MPITNRCHHFCPEFTMKFFGILAIVVCLVVAVSAAPSPKREKRAIITGAMVASAIGDVVMGIADKILGAIFKGHFEHTDEVIEERLIRFTPKGETTVIVTDMDTGIRVTARGADMTEATSTGIARLWTELIRRNKIHVAPTAPPPTKGPCHDKHGRYCLNYARYGYCEKGSSFHKFMSENCRATCSGCTKEHF
ncbi:unnamed protein product [Owenia fusiformis]|uniref:ShKT domain-containing protein n=1 Tax=Owenia fusiformis TaxID=6347 RepID=A0A8S4NHD9_OWEFU|nr:unnamed protein product [Owenia fusiformis]